MMLPILRPDLPRKIKEAYKLAFLVGSMSVKESSKVNLTKPIDCYDKAIAKIGKYDVIDTINIGDTNTVSVRYTNNSEIISNKEIIREVITNARINFCPMYFGISYNLNGNNPIRIVNAVTVPLSGYTLLYVGNLNIPENVKVNVYTTGDNKICSNLSGKSFNYVLFKLKNINIEKIERYDVKLRSELEVKFIKANVSDEPLIYSSYFNATEYIENSKVCETYYMYKGNRELVIKQLVRDTMFEIELKEGMCPISVFSYLYLNKYPKYAVISFDASPEFFMAVEDLNKINKRCIYLSLAYNTFISTMYEGKVNVLISNVTKNNGNIACCIDVFGNVNVKYSQPKLIRE